MVAEAWEFATFFSLPVAGFVGAILEKNAMERGKRWRGVCSNSPEG